MATLPDDVDEMAAVSSDNEVDEVNDTRICVTCSKECGSHWCRICKKPCHAVICGKTDEEEGFGKAVLCNGCSASSEKMGNISKAPLENKDEAFMERFKRLGSSQKVFSSSGNAKRPRKEGGHKNTKMAICLECFEAKKSKFWLSRFNQSTVKEHIKTTHKDSISAARVVQEDALTAKDAVKEYERLTKSRPERKGEHDQRNENKDNSSSLKPVPDKAEKSFAFQEKTLPLDSAMDIGHSSQTERSSSSTLSKVFQESLDKFVPNTVSVAEEHSSGTFPVNADLLASKISKLVLEGLKPSRREQNAASIAVSVSNSPRRQVKASNLLEFVDIFQDIQGRFSVNSKT